MWGQMPRHFVQPPDQIEKTNHRKLCNKTCEINARENNKLLHEIGADSDNFLDEIWHGAAIREGRRQDSRWHAGHTSDLLSTWAVREMANCVPGTSS